MPRVYTAVDVGASVVQMTPLTGADGPNRDTALQAIVTWSTSTSLRLALIEASDFPLPEDLPAFLLINQLIYRGAARPTDLADAIHTGRSNVAKIVRRLEDAGLIIRLPDPRDDRATVVGLSADGREVGQRILDATASQLGSIDEIWTQDEQDTLERLLIKLARTIDAIPGHPLAVSAGLRLGVDPR